MNYGGVVKNMERFYPTIAFGVFILLYAAAVLVVKMYDIAIRLLPMRAKISVVNGPPERQAIAFSTAGAWLTSEQK